VLGVSCREGESQEGEYDEADEATDDGGESE
jgi:hypothetical protein